MKKARRSAALSVLALGLVLSAARVGLTQPAPRVSVSVDPRIELMSIIFRLAGSPEYSQGKVPGYIRDIDRHFAAFQSDPVVKLAVKLRETRGISYNAVMDLAVHVTDAAELKEAVPLDPRPPALDERWTPASAREFLALARKFAAASNFQGFFEAHRSLYERTVERARSMIDKEVHLDWYAAFYGRESDCDFHLVLGLVNGGACYGVHFDRPDGRQDVYSVLGVWEVDAQGDPVFGSGAASTAVHEFNHSYTNPVIDRFAEELRPAAEKIFALVKEEMARQAYGSWKSLLYESLDRACELRYALAYKGPETMKRWAQYEASQGFLWVGDLADVLGEYDTRARVYPDLVAFFPKVVSFFNAYAGTFESKLAAVREKKAGEMEEWRVKGPRIVSLVPANGATDVDPNLKAIVITFDRPMTDKNWAVMLLGDADHFPGSGEGVGYDKDCRVFTIPTKKLRPDWEYTLGLNSEDVQAFTSRDGVPLYPVVIKFKTRK
jgi:hypothetical protein